MDILQTLYVLIYLFVFALIGVSLYYDSKLRVPPAPTLPWVRRKILKALQDRRPSGPLSIAELGSGWGGLAFKMARLFPDAAVTGYELSPFPYGFSKLRGLLYKNVRLVYGDIFTQDLSAYNVVVYYLSPVVSEKLAEKFRLDLKPGTLIISNAFELPGYEAVETLETNVGVKIKIFVYKA